MIFITRELARKQLPHCRRTHTVPAAFIGSFVITIAFKLSFTSAVLPNAFERKKEKKPEAGKECNVMSAINLCSLWRLLG
jgi:hypothetical protein